MPRTKPTRADRVLALCLDEESGVQVAEFGDDDGTPELRQHLPVVESAPAESGRGKVPARTVDILGRLLKAGAIDSEECRAGNVFRRDYHMSRMDPMHCPDLRRIPGQSGGDDDPAMRIEAAKGRVWGAIKALGGIGSINGVAAVEILGEMRTLREFAERQRMLMRRVSEHSAQGMLIGALSLLRAHYWPDGHRGTQYLDRTGGEA